MVPTYMLVKTLHLTNSPLIMIIMGAVSVYNVIITRTFFENSIPAELQEAAELELQKNGLSHSVNGEMVKTGEVEALLKFAEKGEMLTAFDGELFGRFVEQIIVYSRTEVGFQMKCGLTLRERM